MSTEIRRRSLPDSLRWLADKLDGNPTDVDRAGVAVTLHALADEITPPCEPCAAPNPIATQHCTLAAGHDGRHVDGISSWPPVRS